MMGGGIQLFSPGGISRLAQASDIPTLNSGVDQYALVWDNDTQAFVSGASVVQSIGGILFTNSGSDSNVTIVRPGAKSLRIVSNQSGDFGVLDIQNLSAGPDSFAAINFLNPDGDYRFSLGYGTTTFPAFDHSAYLEANNLVGNNAVPPNLTIVQTGTKANGDYDQNVRARFVGNGAIEFYGRTSGTVIGTLAMQISATAKVSIGTNTADFALRVQGNTGAAYDGILFKQAHTTGLGFFSIQNNAGDDLSFYIGGATQTTRPVYGVTGKIADITANGITQFSIGTFASAPLIFGTNSTERARFLATGNFGIQVTVPTAALHLPASTTARASLRIATGVAPTSPNIGDTYSDGDHGYMYLNSGWKQLDN